jgi:hypothetical protein
VAEKKFILKLLIEDLFDIEMIFKVGILLTLLKLINAGKFVFVE